MTQANHALRLQASLKAAAERLAKAAATTLTRSINVAVAEKIAVPWPGHSPKRQPQARCDSSPMVP